MRTRSFALCACLSTLTSARALAENAPPPKAPVANVDTAAQPDDAPLPARPRQKGLVLETTLGVLGFAGKFGGVAPSAFWTHAVVGYELFSWLMLFAQGELAMTDTSESQDASHSRAFPIWGFGGGARVTWHGKSLKSIGVFTELGAGAMTAYVPHGALAQLGFSGAESLGGEVGARIGVEWDMVDPHFALCVAGGPRVALGFSRQGAGVPLSGFAKKAVPLMWDTAVGVRYTF